MIRYCLTALALTGVVLAAGCSHGGGGAAENKTPAQVQQSAQQRAADMQRMYQQRAQGQAGAPR